MPAQTPVWLKDSIVDSLTEVGATASPEELSQQAQGVLDLWSGRTRNAHDVRYLVSLLERLTAFEGIAPVPAVLRLAAAYQVMDADVTKKTIGGTPMPLTAVSENLTKVGVPPETAQRIAHLAAETAAGTFPPGDLDGEILNDASLAVFATAPQIYARQCKRLAGEAGGIPSRQFMKARARYLMSLLSHRHLFRTPIGQRWANALRNNFEGELARLQQSLGEPAVAPRSMEPAPRTGPIVIRGSKALKASRLDEVTARPDAPGDSQTVPAQPEPAPESTPVVAPEPETAKKPLDETSSLEAVEDPFSHRKRR